MLSVNYTMDVGSKNKRKQFSLKEKMDILKEVDQGSKKSDVARMFFLAPSTLSTIIKDREKITKLYEQSSLCTDRKRLRLGDNQALEEALNTWFKDTREKNVPITGPILQAKAKDFAFLMGVTDFQASSGWLHRFRDRYKISWNIVSGEERDADVAAAEKWKVDKLNSILDSYSPDDIFNGDETAYFYKLLPNKTMSYKGDKCTGGKKSKERLSVLFCCNSTGTMKLRPLVIGKSNKPRCFKGVASLPADYASNKRAWMTKDIFSKWLVQTDKEMQKKKKKILLLLDNCAAHVVDVRLENIRLEFLPPNCTAVLQPLDQGIIQNAKVNFRKRLIERILINIRLNLPTNIDVRQAIQLITGGWWNVKKETIANCWRKSGIVKVCAGEEGSNSVSLTQDQASTSSASDTAAAQDCEDIPADLWQDAAKTLQFDSNISFAEYVSVDTDVETTPLLTDIEIVNQVHQQAAADDDPSDDDEIEEECITSKEAVVCVEKLTKFISTTENVPEHVMQSLHNIEQFVQQTFVRNNKQTKISNFFKKVP